MLILINIKRRTEGAKMSLWPVSSSVDSGMVFVYTHVIVARLLRRYLQF